jgi:hypothetical protein
MQRRKIEKRNIHMSNNREMSKEVYSALTYLLDGINFDSDFYLNHLTNKRPGGPGEFDPKQWFRAFMLLERWRIERRDLTPQDISKSHQEADELFDTYATNKEV